MERKIEVWGGGLGRGEEDKKEVSTPQGTMTLRSQRSCASRDTSVMLTAAGPRSFSSLGSAWTCRPGRRRTLCVEMLLIGNAPRERGTAPYASRERAWTAWTREIESGVSSRSCSAEKMPCGFPDHDEHTECKHASLRTVLNTSNFVLPPSFIT